MKFHSNKSSVKRRTSDALKRGLTDAAMAWHGAALLLTPVDTGLLRASLAWAVGERRHRGEATGRDGVVSTSSYDVSAPEHTARLGTNVSYAVAVHEDLTTPRRGGQSAKFVETPLRQNGAAYRKLIARALKAEFS